MNCEASIFLSDTGIRSTSLATPNSRAGTSTRISRWRFKTEFCFENLVIMNIPSNYCLIVPEGAEDEDQPSGITIFSEEEEIKEEYEEGELPEKAEPETPLRKMAAEFSGINAPSPANANQRLWAVHSGGFPGSYPSKHHRFSRSSHSSESHGGRSHERWSEDHRDNRLPSSDTGGYYSPRYSPYGQHPALNRSLSDRERGTPLPDKNSANPFTYPPPPPPPGTTRHSSYHSPTTSGEHWKNYSSYNGITSPSVSSQQARDRHDHHFRNHSRR